MLGGPAFNMPEVAKTWLGIPGLTAIVAAEVDHSLPDLVHRVLSGGDLSTFPGVYLPDGRRGPVAHPLRSLEALPVPDLRAFPVAALSEQDHSGHDRARMQLGSLHVLQ